MKRRINDPELALRMKRLAEIAGNASRLSKMSGLALPTVQKCLTGTADPGLTSLVALCKATGVSIQWLATGEGPMSADAVRGERNAHIGEGEFVFVPMMQGRISAGGGLIPDNNIQMTVAFRKDWIRRKGDHKNMSMIRVEGDSMTPTLLDGDMVLVDHNIETVTASGGIYALTFQDEIIVKRVDKLFPTGQWKVKSDNQNYESFVVEPSDVIVNGKVIWYARNLER